MILALKAREMAGFFGIADIDGVVALAAEFVDNTMDEHKTR